jgi:hypothetical protein
MSRDDLLRGGEGKGCAAFDALTAGAAAERVEE